MAALPIFSTRLTIGILIWSALVTVCVVYLGLGVGTLPAVVAVKFGLAGGALGQFTREVFLLWMFGILLALNCLIILFKARLNGRYQGARLDVPWRTYWSATTRRRTEAVARMNEVMVMAGLLGNGIWLIVYHLLMQEAGGSLGVSISPTFGVYMIVSGAVVLIYGAITYFQPP